LVVVGTVLRLAATAMLGQHHLLLVPRLLMVVVVA